MKLPSINHNQLRTVRADVFQTLAEHSEALTPAVVTTTTLQALHRHYSQITLEDVLELRVLLKSTVNRETPPAEQVDIVIEAALTELTAWDTVPPVSVRETAD
ncbi:hypothetical protein [Halocatena marina]|uniref:Uncharacterized protein n=1 Tax=Halocatena marina TaxID=2934937 RepID=A0ABD5YKT6_9EURY|nr:hypothetical protein [Halocatena marina]